MYTGQLIDADTQAKAFAAVVIKLQFEEKLAQPVAVQIQLATNEHLY